MICRAIAKRKLLVAILLVALGFVGSGAAWLWVRRPQPLETTQLFPGITYYCRALDELDAHGLAHLVIVDLKTPGIELFVTPSDPAAVEAGWEYTTRWPNSVVAEQQLSVLVNGTLYETRRSPPLLPGGWARSTQTIVADHQINHLDPHTYLLWFEDDLTPHMEKTKPPSAEVCRRARWAIGGGVVILSEGQLPPEGTQDLDCRTIAGIDPKRSLLYLAVFDSATELAAARFIAAHGAKDAIVLDGGDSTCLTIGNGAHGVSPRILVYPYRAVATFFGVRAPRSAP